MKTLRTAAMIVGAVALVATGVGAGLALAQGAALSSIGASTALGLSVSTFAAIGSLAGVVGALAAKKPYASMQGSPTEFKINLNAPIPYMIGRTMPVGHISPARPWRHLVNAVRFRAFRARLAGAK